MFCSKCGTQIPDNSKSCNKCGYIFKDDWKLVLKITEAVLVVYFLYMIVQFVIFHMLRLILRGISSLYFAFSLFATGLSLILAFIIFKWFYSRGYNLDYLSEKIKKLFSK